MSITVSVYDLMRFRLISDTYLEEIKTLCLYSHSSNKQSYHIAVCCFLC
jgi:hypothetical protein